MSENHQRREATDETGIATSIAGIAHRLTSEIESLTTLDTAALKRELVLTASAAAGQVLRMAAIVRLLEERGEDLSEVKVGMIRYLRRIAYGQVLPEIVTTFSDYPLLLNRLTSLPLPDQDRIARGESVEVMISTDNGPDVRLIAPINLTAEQVYQVFGDGRVRSDSEQVAYLDAKRVKPQKRRNNVVLSGSIRVDRDSKSLRIGKHNVSAEDVMKAMAELRDSFATDDSPRDEILSPIKVSSAEKEAIRIAAAKSDCSVTELQRRALAACGYLSRY